MPIIGYSTTGSYSTQNQPENFKHWMNDVKEGMENAITKGIKSTVEIDREWNLLKSGIKSPNSSTSVTPLLKTQWDQISPYNSEIPFKTSNITPLTGCAPTAMAQIMKYYNYPTSGSKTTNTYTVRKHNLSIPAIDLTKVVYDWIIC